MTKIREKIELRIYEHLSGLSFWTVFFGKQGEMQTIYNLMKVVNSKRQEDDKIDRSTLVKYLNEEIKKGFMESEFKKNAKTYGLTELGKKKLERLKYINDDTREDMVDAQAVKG